MFRSYGKQEVWSDRISKIGSHTSFQIESSPASVSKTADCLSVCSLWSATLTSAMIKRSNGVRFRSTSITAVVVDFLAPIIARQAIL
jgi:hypothetical protein